ncbi:hypothetical protein [Streptomyces atratus]
MLILGWGAFIYAGLVALYFLARALWFTDEQAVRETGEGAGGAKADA